MKTLLFSTFIFFSSLASQSLFLKSNNIKYSQTKLTQHNEFDYSQFRIRKGQLGEIKIGMTLNEVWDLLIDLELTYKEEEAHWFGIGGGGSIYIFYYKAEPLFGLVPAYDTNTIKYIVTLHEKIKTLHGLGAKSTIEEILAIYPELELNISEVDDSEYFVDLNTNWLFSFNTIEEKKIGEYFGLENSSSKIINTNYKCNHVLIM